MTIFFYYFYFANDLKIICFSNIFQFRRFVNCVQGKLRFHRQQSICGFQKFEIPDYHRQQNNCDNKVVAVSRNSTTKILRTRESRQPAEIDFFPQLLCCLQYTVFRSECFLHGDWILDFLAIGLRTS